MLVLHDSSSENGKWFYVRYRTDTDYNSYMAKIFAQSRADAVTLLRKKGLGKILVIDITT